MAKKKQRTLSTFFILPFQAELFFLPTFQNEENKKQTNEVRSFFFFCQDNNAVVQDNELPTKYLEMLLICQVLFWQRTPQKIFRIKFMIISKLLEKISNCEF